MNETWSFIENSISPLAQETKKCKFCCGGKTYQGNPGNPNTLEEDCSVCKGSGRVKK